MGLRFCLGEVSLNLEERAAKAALFRKRSGVRQILLVPEQAAFRTEKMLLERSGEKVLFGVRVMSFESLAEEVCKEARMPERTVLNRTGKVFLLRRCLENALPKNSVLYKSRKEPGFLRELTSFFKELSDADVDASLLMKTAEGLEKDPVLRRKLEDASLVMEAYQKELADRYDSAEELLPMAVSCISSVRSIKNSEIHMIGFRFLAPSQMNLLRELIRSSLGVSVYLAIPEELEHASRPERHELHYAARNMRDEIFRLAKEASLPIEEELRFHDASDEENSPKRFLEKYLFRYTEESYQGEQSFLRLHIAENPREEVEYVLSLLKERIKKGARYRDFALVLSDLSLYGRLVRESFRREKIPFFIDQRIDGENNPLLRLVRSFLLLGRTASYDDVFRVVKNPLLAYDERDVFVLENLIRANRVRWMSSWKKPLTRMKRSAFTEEEVTKADTLRERICKQVLFATEPFRSGEHTVQEFSDILLQILEDLHMDEILSEKSLILKDLVEGVEGELMASEYAQSYSVLTSLLDQMKTLIGDQRVSVKEFREFIELGFADRKIGLLPPGVDTVIIGDTERSRLGRPNTIFLLGASSSMLPSPPSSPPFLSESDRETLECLPLPPSPAKKNLESDDKLLSLLMSAGKEIHVSYSMKDASREEELPSRLFQSLKELFPLEGKTAGEENRDSFLTGKRRALSLLLHFLRGYREGGELSKEAEGLILELCRAGEAKLIERLVRALYFRYNGTKLSKELLAGNDTSPFISVSQAEEYSRCPYRFFVRYELLAKERESLETDFRIIGSFFHSVLEKVFSVKDIRKKTEEELMLLTEEAVQRSLADNPVLSEDSGRMRAQRKRFHHLLSLSAKTLSDQLRLGDYEVFKTEFSVEEILGSHGDLCFKGIVDRIDTARGSEGELFLRIIDYKSGSQSLSEEKIEGGLQLQLLVYLYALIAYFERKGEKVVPGGAYYYRMTDPLIEAGEIQDEEKLEAQIQEKLRLTGASNTDMEAFLLQETDLEKKSRLVAGLSLKQEEEPCITVATSSGIGESGEELRERAHRAVSMLKDILRREKEGGRDAFPVSYKEGSNRVVSCTDCAYRSICTFEERLPGYKRRELS